ncbi:MAG: winged helix DNA-binding domain-containing protein [Nocardioides sp.]
MDLLPAAWGSASARVAAQLAPQLARAVEKAGLARDGQAWLRRAKGAVLSRLADGAELSAQELREQLPELEGRLELSPDKPYGGSFSVAPRVLTQLGAEGAIVRGRNDGHWRTSRPRWTAMSTWLGTVPESWAEAEGYAELVARWLASFGPGTEVDLAWWLGATKSAVRRTLADLGAREVSLDTGETGWVLPDDTEPEPPVEPWAALLPVLDPTVMGWKERGFLLGPHADALFDRNGNAGTTAWWCGRVVGCWVQDADAVVRVHLLEDVGDRAVEALEVEARRLTAWLDGVRVSTVYPSAAMKVAHERAGDHPPTSGSRRP